MEARARDGVDMGAFLLASAGLMAYYLLALLVLPMSLRLWGDVPDECVRKAQHLGYGASIWLLLTWFDRWYLAIAASALLVAIAYPALLALERWSGYARTFPDRKPGRGELRRSLLWVQASFALNVALFWGLGGAAGRVALAAGVTAWTLGDALAALIGRALGRHAANGRFLAGDKTAEGTTAMAVVAAAAVAATVATYGGVDLGSALAAGLVAGPVAAAVELYSPHGTDTWTVPVAAASAVWLTVTVCTLLGAGAARVVVVA
jgi:dolichol kinase